MSDQASDQTGEKIIGYVPGVFDLFHVGHLNMLRQARSRCDILVAGIVSDEMCEQGKGIRPTVPLVEREAIVDAIGIVDATYVETTLDKRDAWRDVRFHRLFKGDDWKGTPKGDNLEKQMAEVGVEVCYFPYSIQTSSTALRQHLKRAAEAVS
ncbi:adenylyltransferase/cytidyltransferase family protein [Nocardioides sp.]|uniref:adenylyltransferase/cytidyltransferase family protein n=1 Tax=Nocardioides sp. TaxID=35761 RepID=UPI00260AEE11|nr:adenylyltransferase/cytidyltransferase family protein [Nocardioides sp.]